MTKKKDSSKKSSEAEKFTNQPQITIPKCHACKELVTLCECKDNILRK